MTPRRRSRRWQAIAASVAACAVAAGAVALPAAAAAPSGTTTTLGSGGFGTLAVSARLSRVFVSEPLANTVDEFDFRGRRVGSIHGLYGAWGMTIHAHKLYVAESTTGEIVSVALGARNQTPQLVASGLQDPKWLVMTGGRLWTTEDTSGQWGSVVSVDPDSGATAALSGIFYDPDLAVSAGDPSTLFVAEDGLSPGAIFRFDVSTSPASRVAANTFTDQENIEDIAVSADGKRVIPASGYPYLFEELNAASLQPDGLRYPGKPYPSAVAVSKSGLLATGPDNGYSTPDIAIYPLGQPAPMFTAPSNNPDGTANVVPHGLALNRNGQTLFAVTKDESNQFAFHSYGTR